MLNHQIFMFLCLYELHGLIFMFNLPKMYLHRKKDTSSVSDTIVTKTSCEPRIVVQTTSAVDIVNDGYRWRKYGQKLVKGNSNPRYIFYSFDIT